MLKKWKHFKPYALLNSLAVFIYLFVFFFTSMKLFFNDEYGLKKIFLFLFIITFHTIIGFIFALYYKFTLSEK